MSEPTASQKAAILARGNVLVEAGAGAGKTRTLVERCLAWLLDENSPGSLDEILMVTFTEAAAAEMRQRLRAELDKLIARELDPKTARHLAEQLALLDRAWIGTLHSFCFELVRRHFYKLGLDPRLSVLTQERTAVYQRQAVGALLDRHYRDETPEAVATLALIEAHGKDWDKQVCDLVLRLHEYAQSLRDPKAWFAAQAAYFGNPAPDEWRAWLAAELSVLRPKWMRLLQTRASGNSLANECFCILLKLPPKPSLPQFGEALGKICEAHDEGKKKLRAATEDVVKDARFLRSLCGGGADDPLAQDWSWVRESMLTLIRLSRQFGEIYARTKQEAGGLDFQDLEQFALQVLLDRQTGRPSEAAAEWRKKLRMIFVDEYQDINGAQEAIIDALGRAGDEANTFLVGDVKQSIYRFRRGDPRIFLKRKQLWKTSRQGRVIALPENFRSHAGILRFVNSLFDNLMCEEAGGIGYDEDARLRPGNGAASAPGGGGREDPRVELHVCIMKPADETPQEDPPEETQLEARMVARRLHELRDRATPVWDSGLGRHRPARWSDMVVLLRAPRSKVEAYVKVFEEMGVPPAAAPSKFYESLEVRDLTNLLRILDNPLQDVPLLGVLASPLAGLAPHELAAVRISKRSCHFWHALLHWHEASARDGAENIRLREKVSRFLGDYKAWRRLSRLQPVSHCLEAVLDQTHYAAWLSAEKRGAQRCANIDQLLQLTRQFDSDRGEGLYRFLRFVETQQKNDIDIEPAPTPIADAVRIMSIHQSKGLEFPIVVLAGLAKTFNLQDARGRVILDEELGLCPQVNPPGSRRFYPSLAHWLAGRRQKRETYGEELRLLYVAATRARERLILAGTAGLKLLAEKCPRLANEDTRAGRVLGGDSYLDWIGAWLLKTHTTADLAKDGESPLISWKIHDGAKAVFRAPSQEPAVETEPKGDAAKPAIDAEKIRERLEWSYPFEAATELPAKAAVSALSRQIAELDDEESARVFSGEAPFLRGRTRAGQLSAAEIGSAHHAFLEMGRLDQFTSAGGLKEEAERLCREQLLSPEQIACLDFDALAGFWQSEIGKELLKQPEYVRRELAFTARFSCGDLGKLGAVEFAKAGEKEFVVVQGVIDLAVVLPKEIWLVDFKTDNFAPQEQADRVKTYGPQLALYAAAVEHVYDRPVTNCWLHFLNARQTVRIACRAERAPCLPSLM